MYCEEYYSENQHSDALLSFLVVCQNLMSRCTVTHTLYPQPLPQMLVCYNSHQQLQDIKQAKCPKTHILPNQLAGPGTAGRR